LAFVLAMFCSTALFGQGSAEKEKNQLWADSLLEIMRGSQSMGASLKLELADSIYSIYKTKGDRCKMLEARMVSAVAINDLGQPDSALSSLIQAESMFTSTCDSMLLPRIALNYSYIYLSLDEFSRLDSICEKSLREWNDKWSDKDLLMGILNNLSISKAYQGQFKEADRAFRELLKNARVYRSPKFEQRALLNLGTLQGMQENLDSAYYFFDQASKSALADNDFTNHIAIVTNLAGIEKNRGRYKQSLALLDSAFHMAEENENLDLMGQVQKAQAEALAGSGDFKSAFEMMNDFNSTRENYLNEERVKAVAEMTEKYESEKKARQIQKLELDNLDAELQNEKVTQSRNRLLFGGLGLLILAVGLFSRLRFVRRSRAAIQKEKDVSEGLLLNILPLEVADELKAKGYADAKNFDRATILFSDFKGFTALSEKLTPAELVAEIDVCFKAFDAIMEKYKIEKIKTIGDAYMAAGGLPDPQGSGPLEVVLAGLEMQDFIIARKLERDASGQPAFAMRVGIHTGPVIAGIVGVKKFQYDIWGDTVNTASRMESSGEAEKVNISETTYNLIKSQSGLRFDPRGLIVAKGKGEISMF
jgi:adenylate cyclase